MKVHFCGLGPRLCLVGVINPCNVSFLFSICIGCNEASTFAGLCLVRGIRVTWQCLTLFSLLPPQYETARVSCSLKVVTRGAKCFVLISEWDQRLPALSCLFDILSFCWRSLLFIFWWRTCTFYSKFNIYLQMSNLKRERAKEYAHKLYETFTEHEAAIFVLICGY